MTDRLTETRLRGVVAVLGSALLFATATILVKLLTRQGISPSTVAFGRFLLGAVVLSVWFAWIKRSPRPRHWRWVLARAITNTSAVLLFYKAIELTTVTKANILNMTYPIFVGLLGPLLLKEQTGPRQIVALFLGFLGIWMVIDPGFGRVARGDVVGLLCGAVSSIAVLTLRRARAYDDADAIVWFVMVSGTLVLAPAAANLRELEPAQWGLWIAAGACGVIGQLLITFGYRYVTAVDGSIASSARILFAAALGTAIFGDPVTTQLVAGTALVLLAIYLVSTKRRGLPDAPA